MTTGYPVPPRTCSPVDRTTAERTGRVFYIMYDVTGWANMQSELKTDWTTKMSAHTASSAYARQNGKPVVCVWGFGVNDDGRPFTPAQCLDVVNWFRDQGCYVIGGVPTYWREGRNDSRTGFLGVYHAFHMLSPWMVGRTGDLAGLDWFAANVNAGDQPSFRCTGEDALATPPPGTDLARGRPATAGSQVQAYGPGNAVDADAGSYWESAGNAFPQWLQVDLGSAVPIGRAVLRLPPSWGARTQTLAISGSTDGSTFTTLAGAAGRAFNPASGNTVTLSFPAASTRYLRVTATANSGWPAGQLSALEAYAN